MLLGSIMVCLSHKISDTLVFYDSWAIQPGDGIIDKMNAGLEACRLGFYPVSADGLIKA